jgi:hypothetical protein
MKKLILIAAVLAGGVFAASAQSTLKTGTSKDDAANIKKEITSAAEQKEAPKDGKSASCSGHKEGGKSCCAKKEGSASSGHMHKKDDNRKTEQLQQAPAPKQ